MHLPTIIYRHKKEKKKKCSLTCLENKEDFIFYQYPQKLPLIYEDYILLDLQGPILTKRDCNNGLFIIDGTWNYAKKMQNSLNQKIFHKRSLPTEIRTAYPRKQTGCHDPTRGLASIEALFTAYFILEKNIKGLLDHYYWKDLFLEKNSFFFQEP